MRVRSIDSNNDWNFGKGRNDYKYNIHAVAQNIKTRLQSFFNDCFFDKDAGIDWFNLLGGKNYLAIQLAVNSTILNTEGVISITSISLSVDPNTREMKASYTVLTIYGRVIDNYSVGIPNA